MSESVILSIVIPTKNRAKLLEQVLDSIERQPADPDVYEVIVVDNGSTDETKDIVGKCHKKIKNLRYFYDARPGLHVGRNKGLLKSRGELVGYLDDDVVLFPNWINTILKAFEDKKVSYVGGSVIPYDMSLITADFRKRYEIRRKSFCFIYSISCFWENGISEEDVRIHPTPEGGWFGGNCVYRKSVLIACKGFHPDGMPNNLLMYRGDGENYVAEYMRAHKMKAMYYAQASAYHMIDVNRVGPDYINYMYFRNGITYMYNRLRKGGLKEAMRHFGLIAMEIIQKRSISSMIRGKLYLLLYYILYKRVRIWVHKENYF